MKLKSLLASMMACMALAACTNQDLVEDDNIGGDKTGETKAYIGIRIADPANGISRATDEFENGDTSEHAIFNALFMFYTDGINPIVGKIYTEGIPTSPAEDKDNVIEANSTAVLALNLKETNKFPNQVVAFLNLPQGVSEKIKTLTLTQAAQYVAELSDIQDYVKGDNGFIMTNSVYIDKKNEIKYATDVAEFAQTESDALNHPVLIYVERLAAKVRMAKKSNWNDQTDMPDHFITMSDNKNYSLKLKIDGWALNGTNQDAFLLKKVRTDWTDSNVFSSWNEANRHRSYWAEDNNYTGDYPRFYDEFENKYNKETPLNYKTWNEIAANGTEPQYCLENTMDAATATKNINSTTHMVIAGHYELYDDNDEQVTNIKELYRFNLNYYTRIDLIKTMANRIVGGIYTNNNGSYEQVSIDRFNLTESKHAGEVQLLFNGTDELTYYKKTDKGYVPYDNVAEIQSILEQLGTATAYADGLKTYFYTPIKHLNTTEGGLGYYGIVRNHSYVLNLTSIREMGHGVYDPEHEIIIEEKDKEFFVAAELHIQSWRIVSHDVDL